MSRRVEAPTACRTIGLATTLGWARDEEAAQYMRQLMLRADTLLTAHGWKIAHLKEFYPRSARLLGLNVNKGDEVCVRFREAGQRDVFLPFHEVLCTLIHEIAHCRHSNHGRAFWELYAQLVIECERIELGMAMTQPRPDGPPRFTGGGRLGGGAVSPPPGESRRHLLAAAADRRRRAESCARDDPHDEPHADTWRCGRCGNRNADGRPACGFCTDAQRADEWACGRCAFANCLDMPRCEACGFARASPPLSGACAVQRVRALPFLPHFMAACRVLGELADAIWPVLRERRWQLLCLEEICPAAPRTASQAVTLGGGRVVVQVRLRAAGQPGELLPHAHAHGAVVHQLAHLLQPGHGAAFVAAWVSLLHAHCRAVAAAGGEALAGLLGLTAQLERVVIAQHHWGGEKTGGVVCVRGLHAGCATVAKRERTPEDAAPLAEDLRWDCPACSFANEALLLCEVCGAARPLCAGAPTATGATREKPFLVE